MAIDLYPLETLSEEPIFLGSLMNYSDLALPVPRRRDAHRTRALSGNAP